MLESGKSTVRLTAAGVAVDRAFVIAQEIALIQPVYLAMSTRTQYYEHPDGDYLIHISTITISKAPITQRQKNQANGVKPPAAADKLERQDETDGGAAKEGEEEDGEEASSKLRRPRRQPRRRNRGGRGGARSGAPADEDKACEGESGEHDSDSPKQVAPRRERRWRPPRGGRKRGGDVEKVGTGEDSKPAAVEDVPGEVVE